MIPFGPLQPDLPPTVPGHCRQADNVLPLATGYGPMQGLSVPTSAVALGGAPRGVYSPVKADGTWQVFGFTASDLYPLSATGVWGSALDTGLACPDGYNFSAAPFGAYFLYTNTVDGLRAYDIESGGAASAVAAAGDPEFIFAATSSQLVALNCQNDAGTRDNRLMRVSAFNDHTDWSSRGAGQQAFENGGAVICGAPLTQTSAVVLQERAVRMIEFGQFGTVYFRTQLVAEGPGSVGAKSMVPYSGAVYWLATDGFCRLTAGGGIERIGAGRVDNWFLSSIDQAKMHLVEGAVDPFNKIIWWRYKATGDTDIVFSRMIGYSWQWDRWVTATVTTTALTRLATPGYTLDDLTTLYGTLDAIPGVLGSRLFQGGQPVFAALNGSYKIGFFSGDNLAATLETSTANNPITGLLQWCTPSTDAENATVSLGVSDRLSDSITYDTGVAIGESGRVPLDGRGMNIAFKMEVPADETWTYAVGIDHIVGSRGGPL